MLGFVRIVDRNGETVELKEKVYRISEASDLLGVHPNTIRRWENEGKIKVIRIGKGHRKIPESEINRILGGFKEIETQIGPIRTSGENLPAFLNFVFSEHKDDWDLVKKAVIIRDNYTCQECGGRDMLDVHHRDGSGRNDPENLVTLCRNCHGKKHSTEVITQEKPKIEAESPILSQIGHLKEEKPPETRKEMTRQEVLDILSPSGLAQRATFGQILPQAALLEKFTVQDLASHARCPEIVANAFCEQMEKHGLAKRTDGICELTVKVTK